MSAPRRVKGRLSRDGIQIYGDLRELRPASEVFAARALQTLAGLRVQSTHADGMPSLGKVVPGSITRHDASDASYVVAQLEIHCADTCRAIDASAASGTPYQISLAYSCELDFTPGVTARGEKYDCVQRDIRFDSPGAHCALLDTRAGLRARCGESCSITKDGTMPIRHSDSITLTLDAVAACSCADQDTKDRWDAHLDHFADTYGLSRTAIVNEMARVNDPALTNISKQLIKDACERISRPGSYDGTRNVVDAVFHVPSRHDFASRIDLNDDDQFRQSLRQKQDGGRTDAHQDATDLSALVRKLAPPGTEGLTLTTLEQQAAAEMKLFHKSPREAVLSALRQIYPGYDVPKGDSTDGAHLDSDDAFRAMLATQLDGGAL